MKTSRESLIQLKNAHLYLDGKEILKDISMDISPHEWITLIGPNGGGKTSLIRVLLGLQNLTSGIRVQKKNLIFGYVPQKLSLDPSLPLKVQDLFESLGQDHHFSKKYLEQVDGGHLWARPFHTLSGGETQRVLLARALSQNPHILALDEPTQGMDILGQEKFFVLMNELRKNHGLTIILVSHDLHFVHRSSSQVYCLNGHICCAGHPSLLHADPIYQNLFGMALYHHHHDHTHEEHHKND
jgi:zinc transport system ATP-binding protein